jgi:hypothetical protein
MELTATEKSLQEFSLWSKKKYLHLILSKNIYFCVKAWQVEEPGQPVRLALRKSAPAWNFIFGRDRRAIKAQLGTSLFSPKTKHTPSRVVKLKNASPRRSFPYRRQPPQFIASAIRRQIFYLCATKKGLNREVTNASWIPSRRVGFHPQPKRGLMHLRARGSGPINF